MIKTTYLIKKNFKIIKLMKKIKILNLIKKKKNKKIWDWKTRKQLALDFGVKLINPKRFCNK